jgi:hypothetical protein
MHKVRQQTKVPKTNNSILIYLPKQHASAHRGESECNGGNLCVIQKIDASAIQISCSIKKRLTAIHGAAKRNKVTLPSRQKASRLKARGFCKAKKKS